MINAAIIGASGYSGVELLRLLSKRRDVHIRTVTARHSAGKRVDELYPVFSGEVNMVFDELHEEQLQDTDVVFIALPSGEAMAMVPGLLQHGTRIIDLGGDFRLQSVKLYEEYYKHSHKAPHLLSEAVYGLPELHTQLIRGARLLANPGCYPTSVILPLLPALVNHLIEPTGIVINSLSGVSGAGRSASLEMSFSEINENIRAYKIGRHQHIPEIETVLQRAYGSRVSVSFVPHLVPITRGIYTTIHASINGAINEQQLLECYESFFRNAPFIRIKRAIPQVKDVLYTNYCDIYCALEPRTHQLILISVIDNLIKGAAGQAIQNMNIMFGLPEETGLKGKDNHQ